MPRTYAGLGAQGSVGDGPRTNVSAGADRMPLDIVVSQYTLHI